MKNNINKVFTCIVFLLANVAIFAQPGSGSDLGNLETPDTTAAPIDNMLFILILVGIGIAFYTFRNNRKTI